MVNIPSPRLQDQCHCGPHLPLAVLPPLRIHQEEGPLEKVLAVGGFDDIDCVVGSDMQHIDKSNLGGEDPFDGPVPASLEQTVSFQRPLHCHPGDVPDCNSRYIQEGLHSLYKGLIPSLLSVGGAMAYFNIY